jgi:hypothetical protein
MVCVSAVLRLVAGTRSNSSNVDMSHADGVLKVAAHREADVDTLVSTLRQLAALPQA